mmetsp:Transcript_77518/g.179692  ORF Transcript_77518/g.179692 Transcript_77518/m.179692 type:complete len:254 (+) Transcript_77518:707-1468(+)
MANGALFDFVQARLRLIDLPDALKRSCLPEPCLVVIRINPHCCVGRLYCVGPILKLYAGLGKILENGNVQIHEHLVLSIVRSLEPAQCLISLPPAGMRLRPIALLPLQDPVLLALASPVHHLGEGLDVCDAALLLLLLDLLLGQLLSESPPTCIILHHHGIRLRLAARVNPVPKAFQDLSVLLVVEAVPERPLQLRSSIKHVVEMNPSDSVLHDGGHDPLDVRRSILKQLCYLLAPYVHVLHRLILFHPGLPP